MENQKHIVLITAIGTITATAIIQQLNHVKERFILIGADINPANEIVSSKDVDMFYVFPSAVEDKAGYLEFVLEFCKKHGVHYLFPVIDEEVLNYSMHRDRFDEINVRLCIPNTRTVDICHFKDYFSGWIRENIPELWIEHYKDISQINDSDLPVFVKPIEGRGSSECMRIDSVGELRRIQNLSQYIIQKYVDGEVITCDIIRNAKYKQIEIVQRKELLRNRNGCGIAVKTVKYEELDRFCRVIAELLDLNGVINAEFFISDETFKIIEINPRFSAGSIYTYMAGCELAVNAIRIVDGEACCFGGTRIGKHYARRYEAYEL